MSSYQPMGLVADNHMLKKQHHASGIVVVLCVLALNWCANDAHAQTPAPAAPPAADKAPPTTTAAVSAVEIAGVAESDQSRLTDLSSGLATQAEIDSISSALNVFEREIEIRLKESKKIVAARSSVSSLQSLEHDWLELRKTLDAWKRSLDSHVQQSEQRVAALADIEARWKNTQAAIEMDSTTPPAIRTRVNDMLGAIRNVDAQITQSRTKLLTLQNRVASKDARIANEIEAIRKARTQAMSRLLEKDSPSIWMVTHDREDGGLMSEVDDSLNTQWAGLRAYAERRTETFARHMALFLALLVALQLVARQVRKWVSQEPDLRTSTKVFDTPIAMAALLSLLLSPWIYPQAPRLWTALLSAIGLIPAVIILRHVLMRALHPALNALSAFFLLDQLRELTAAIGWASRIVLFIEAFAGVALIAYQLRFKHVSAAEQAALPRFWRVLKIAYYVALALLLVSLLANTLGFAELANILASTLLSSAYAGLFFYALLRLADGIMLSALRLYPLGGLRMVQRHRPLIRHRILRGLQLLTWVLWTLNVLERLSLRAPLFDYAGRILSARSNLGSLHVSLGDVLACALAIFAAFTVSRLLRFALEEEVYPHLHLPRGMPYALSRLSHYVILVIGFIAAIAVAGVDLTRFTILVSAFGVGIGFGLQQIINNFVSGIILLFERPVQVGDAVQIADIAGVIERIGIRASVVRLGNGATVIVPNSGFITERITNRALTNPERNIEIRVGVAYGSDPQTVVSLLSEAAGRHEHVSKSPPPQVLFAEFAENAVYFILRASIDDPSRLVQTKSELGMAVNELFAHEKLRPPARQNIGVVAEPSPDQH